MTKSPDPDSGTDLLADVQSRVELILCANGMPEESARKTARKLYHDLKDHWSGLQVYIKKHTQADLSERDIQIYEEFNGRNHVQLARKFKISLPHVYKIVKLMHQFEQDRRQGKLALDSPGGDRNS